jgi:hypothetical protein
MKEIESNLRVWKYVMSGPSWSFLIPIGAKVLTVGIQDHRVVIWALVDITHETEKRGFLGVGTGGVVPEDAKYIGTVFYETLVHHIFEVPPEKCSTIPDLPY